MGKKKPSTENGKTDTNTPDSTICWCNKMFGFSPADLKSPQAVIKLLCRPSDPACLGVVRFLFGFLMLLDIPQERGLGMADVRWGNNDECRFPLFNFLKPLPLEWMYIVYFVMLLGAAGIMVGFLFRFSCICFLLPYWYIFFLDKTSWNNHSYLYGILGFLLTISDANRYWSLDGLFSKNKRNTHVPLWNYTLLRLQVFLVYFIAGLKKLDFDWVYGYSMQNLSRHWVFDPLKFMLTEEQIDLFVVHLGGLTIDLSIGFLFFFDKTRPLAFLVCSSFHLMNSQMFSIGMFPWMMLATQVLFCHTDWPRRVFKMIPTSLQLFTPEEEEIHASSHCIYGKDDVKSEDNKQQGMKCGKAPPTKSTLYHKISTCFTFLFIILQLILPYSHGITKGYNNWTNGLYGYSWDMMVHSWSVQHIRITYVNKDTGEAGYLNPEAWVGSRRWSSHADMLKQHAQCIAGHLKTYNITNVALHFDIWKSLNERFQQRMFDPKVDIQSVEWSPLKETPWLMPLLVDLSDWRGKLAEIEKSLTVNSSESADVVFVADFPGLYLENYVQEDLGNTSITVLKGKVLVELVDKHKNYTLMEGESMQVPAGNFHNVHTISSTPSCYMYIYVNTTDVNFMENLIEYEKAVNGTLDIGIADKALSRFESDPLLAQYKQALAAKKAVKKQEEQTLLEKLTEFIKNKYIIFSRSFRFTTGALHSILSQRPFEEFLNDTYSLERDSIIQSVDFDL
ncbi:vitamin K-dependent gamma-carboxylase [Patella vulgata]|uniref:vitamin K-dependent gamma-carboxylase n=1 Tax=Patella vulgata TaxID=6465 RepID=UPI0024A7C133|nr:vitamin K-dependent gamma-carboxylase [Patella vulgata]